MEHTFYDKRMIKEETRTPERLVSRPRNTMTFADGSCEVRSRSEEEAMQGHRRRRATQRSPATPINPKGGGGTASISLSLLLHDVTDIASSSLRNSTPSRSPQISWYSWDETLARTMHKFSTAATPPSSERSEGIIRRAVRTDCATRNGCPRAWRNAPRSTLSSLRDKNLCIVRARYNGP